MKIEKLSKSFGNKEVFKDYSVNIEENKVTYIMGESGCGKTTLLRILSGLDKNFSGNIDDVLSRKISYVFQEPRLFPNLTVRKNIELVNENSSISINEALNLVELQNDANTFPNALSGGMKMRLSLARALYHNGDIYLMDEPFSALDQDMKDRIIPKVFDFLKGKTIIVVSHDINEAKKYADTIIVLNNII